MVWLSLLVAFDDAFVCEGVVWDVEGKLICCVAQQNPQSRELIPSFLMLHLLHETNIKDKCQSYQAKIDIFYRNINAINGELPCITTWTNSYKNFFDKNSILTFYQINCSCR